MVHIKTDFISVIYKNFAPKQLCVFPLLCTIFIIQVRSMYIISPPTQFYKQQCAALNKKSGRRIKLQKIHSYCHIYLCGCMLSARCVRLFASLWTVTSRPICHGALQAGTLEGAAILPFLPPGESAQVWRPHLRSSAWAGSFFNTNATWEDHDLCSY